MPGKTDFWICKKRGSLLSMIRELLVCKQQDEKEHITVKQALF